MMKMIRIKRMVKRKNELPKKFQKKSHIKKNLFKEKCFKKSIKNVYVKRVNSP